jgi:hypothetical protein
MGFHFRRTRKLGPFRLTFTEKGIGYSYGNKFARVSRSATGRKTLRLSLPGTGLFYTSTLNKKKKRRR